MTTAAPWWMRGFVKNSGYNKGAEKPYLRAAHYYCLLPQAWLGLQKNLIFPLTTSWRCAKLKPRSDSSVRVFMFFSLSLFLCPWLQSISLLASGGAQTVSLLILIRGSFIDLPILLSCGLTLRLDCQVCLSIYKLTRMINPCICLAWLRPAWRPQSSFSTDDKMLYFKIKLSGWEHCDYISRVTPGHWFGSSSVRNVATVGQD